jgi:hypothetical protein
LEAFLAVNWPTFHGTEWDLCISSTFCTSSRKHFPRSTVARAAVAAVSTAFPTALGFIFETFLSIEFLLTSCKNELLAAILAN